jgi:hypothetical protein
MDEDVSSIEITEETSLAIATDLLGNISVMKKALDKEHRFFKDPILGIGRFIDSEFNKLTENLGKTDGILRGKVLSSGLEFNAFNGDFGKLNKVEYKKWEITDWHLVPEEYKIVDVIKVKKMVEAGIEQIPGIKIWKEEALRVSVKK